MKSKYMTIPVYCQTPGCSHEGQIINEVSGIAPIDLDDFYENWPDGASPDDWCSFCKKLGVAEDPENEARDYWKNE